MESFGKTLKDSIDSLGLSTNQFSKKSEINRGQLYNIFLGKKSLSQDKFKNMLLAFNFSNAQKQLLQESYYCELYGEKDFKKIKYIINNFNELSAEEKKPKDNITLQVLEKSEFKDLTFGEKDITNLIANVLQYEAECENPKCITNFPYSFEALDDGVFNSLSLCKNRVDFKHIINFDKEGTGIHNLRNMFKSIKYLRNKYNCWYYYSNAESTACVDNAFPYYFLCSEYLILINSTCSIALLITDKKAIEAHFSLLNESLGKWNPLAIFPNDALEFKSLVAEVGLNEEWSHLSYYPCCTTKCFTSEILHEIGQENLENREWLINAVINHYSMITNTPGKHYFIQCEGYKQFSEDGKVYEIPGKYMKNLPPHLRRDVLNGNLDDIENNVLNINLVKEDKLLIPTYLFLLIFNNNLFTMLGFCSDNVAERYYGEFTVLLSDNVLSNDIRNFEKYILENDYCHSQDFVKYLLTELAAKNDLSEDNTK